METGRKSKWRGKTSYQQLSKITPLHHIPGQWKVYFTWKDKHWFTWKKPLLSLIWLGHYVMHSMSKMICLHMKGNKKNTSLLQNLIKKNEQQPCTAGDIMCIKSVPLSLLMSLQGWGSVPLTEEKGTDRTKARVRTLTLFKSSIISWLWVISQFHYCNYWPSAVDCGSLYLM